MTHIKIAYSCDYKEADGRVINRERQSLLPHYAEVVKRLSDNGKPLDVEQYVAEGRQVSDGKKAMDIEKEDEMELLKEVKSSSLLPLSSKGEMLGIISLGPRLGGLPHSRGDEQMLMSVAGPATLAIENAILVEQMIVEAGLRQELEAENEIRAKELEEARQLQLSMLPKSVPQLPHLEIEAYMKPAAEVGGDYYDYSRTMETLARAAAMAPREIIERLVDAGEAWAEGRPQDDDITFVALEVK